MPSKKVVGELIYQIKGDDTEYSKTINRADESTEKLTKTMGRNQGALDGTIKSLAGSYLGYQTLTKSIEATIGSAISYESAFAGVRKTVDGTEEQLRALSDEFIAMSKTMPTTADEFARIGEIAGQLGVPIEQISIFSKTVAMIADTTNLTQEQASTDFARFANIMQMPLENIGNLGSAVVDLGNKGASTEQEIIAMALRIAGAGATLGLTEPQVLGWANALSSLGIEAEMGGSAISRTMLEIATAVSGGGKNLQSFALVAGMSADEFKKKFQEDANGAIVSFIDGLRKMQSGGGDTIAVLDSLGITEIRQRDTLLRLANSGDVLKESIDNGNTAWKDNTALQTEAEKRYKTTASQLEILKNNWTDLGRSVGSVMLPILNTAIKVFIDVSKSIETLSDEILLSIKYIAGATGLIWTVGKLQTAFLATPATASVATRAIGAVRTSLIALRTALLAVPVATILTVGLVGYELVMNSIRNLKREIGEQVDSELALADTRSKALLEASKLSKSENKNVQELGKARIDFYQKLQQAQDTSGNQSTETAKKLFATGKATLDLQKELLTNQVSPQDELAKSREKLQLAQANVNADKEALSILNKKTPATDAETEASAKLKKEQEELLKNLQGLNGGNKKANEEAEKLADNWKKLGDETVDLKDKGIDALKDLANENVIDLEKIDEKIKDVKDSLADLKKEYDKDISSQDTDIAERILEEKKNIEDLQKKLEEARKEKTPDYAELDRLQAEISKRQLALNETIPLQETLKPQIAEATRRSGLTDLQRDIEDYNARKTQRTLEYEEKKAILELQLADEEANKASIISLYADKQAQINSIIELGNQRFKDLADNRVKITEDEVNKQIRYYNQLADAIARSKSATRTSELPKFSAGGYVANGGEVHAGEYVIPANMVAKYGGLIKALEGVRTGASNSNTVNNNITLNNAISEQIDMEAVLKNMSFELNK